MSIFDQDRIGKSVLCEVHHEARSECRQAYVRWTHASEGKIVRRVRSISEGWLAGPWVVGKVDVLFKGYYA